MNLDQKLTKQYYQHNLNTIVTPLVYQHLCFIQFIIVTLFYFKTNYYD